MSLMVTDGRPEGVLSGGACAVAAACCIAQCHMLSMLHAMHPSSWQRMMHRWAVASGLRGCQCSPRALAGLLAQHACGQLCMHVLLRLQAA